MDALNGKIRRHHREMLQMHLDTIAFLFKQVEQLETKIERLIQPYEQEITLLDTIPGINRPAAATILAELGPNMGVFPSESHAVASAGLAPGNNESTGVKKSPRLVKATKR